jgi:alpha-beta hydrolase superfamily lysophospholipase
VATLFLTVLLVRAFDARRGPPLEPWHRERLREEFTARKAGTVDGLDAYLELEARLFDEMERQVVASLPAGTAPWENRWAHHAVSPSIPDWNRTVVLHPEALRGGVLLLHGLTDSPYSLRHIAELYQRQGFYVLALRLPGHGTLPAGLLHADMEDWLAATALGVRHVGGVIGDQKPFHLVGYSNGGALGLLHVVREVERGGKASIDRLVLISPMIGVTRTAWVSRFISWIGFVPFFEQSRWMEVQPEYMPYKYNSFPAHAAFQSHALSTALRRRLARLAKQGRMDELPPLLTFQSVVDATVRTSDVVDGLYRHLHGEDHRLVLFNPNTFAGLRSFLRPRDWGGAVAMLEDESRTFPLTVVANRDENHLEVVARSSRSGSQPATTRDLAMAWPEQVYSLSHVALPMPPDDPVYGFSGWIGGASPRGERGMLAVPLDQAMRLYCNPFYAYLESALLEWAGLSPPLPE